VSIITKTGDDGTTALMYGRRVPKSHPRVEACGAIDELNAALGMARAVADKAIGDRLLIIQKELVMLMGELATLPEDFPRYTTDGFERITAGMVEQMERFAHETERENPAVRDWVMPGANIAAATLDSARAVCRRAERSVCGLTSSGEVKNSVLIVYLNRLSDLLWLLARKAERKP
jgi:cob(I)alamin adenosyltransferase